MYEVFDLFISIDVCKARDIIPDELEGWVIESIHALWKGYKGRTKVAQAR